MFWAPFIQFSHFVPRCCSCSCSWAWHWAVQDVDGCQSCWMKLTHDGCVDVWSRMTTMAWWREGGGDEEDEKEEEDADADACVLVEHQAGSLDSRVWPLKTQSSNLIISWGSVTRKDLFSVSLGVSGCIGCKRTLRTTFFWGIHTHTHLYIYILYMYT